MTDMFVSSTGYTFNEEALHTIKEAVKEIFGNSISTTSVNPSGEESYTLIDGYSEHDVRDRLIQWADNNNFPSELLSTYTTICPIGSQIIIRIL